MIKGLVMAEDDLLVAKFQHLVPRAYLDQLDRGCSCGIQCFARLIGHVGALAQCGLTGSQHHREGQASWYATLSTIRLW